MTTKHHIQRIASALVLSATFIYLAVRIESWLFLGLLCLSYLLICGVIIAIDTAHEINDENMEL